MDEQLLAEIERAHCSTECDVPSCWECADDWPCETIQLVAEVRRLQKSESSYQKATPGVRHKDMLAKEAH